MANHPDVLYHYCSLETFYHIIKNRTIRLSDIRKTNDSEETVWLPKIYYEYLYNKVRKKAIDANEYIPYAVASFDCLADGQTLFTSESLLKSWVLCLSTKGDLLSQWRGYADDGCGISIGFKYDSLKPKQKNIGDGSAYPFFDLRRVTYIDELKTKQKERADEVVGAVFNASEPPKRGKNPITELFGALGQDSNFYKKSAFREESEWRLVYGALGTGFPEHDVIAFMDNHNQEQFEFKSFDFMLRRGTLVSYFDLAIKDFGNAIKEIIIGPKANITHKTIEQFLIANGLKTNFYGGDIVIRKSQASYR